MSGMSINTKATITDEFRDILKNQKYEEFILKVLNSSRDFFPNKNFESVENQSAGEADYIDKSGEKYEVKLILDTEQGALIGDKKNSLEEWIRIVLDECSEFSECIEKRDVSMVCDMKLYKIIEKHVSKIKSDEIGILFAPFQIALDVRESVFTELCTDYLQAIYSNLDSAEKIKCKELYFIYPSMERDYVVLRNCKNRAREYIYVKNFMGCLYYDTW